MVTDSKETTGKALDYELQFANEKLAILTRIIRRALACHQWEKLEDALPYLSAPTADRGNVAGSLDYCCHKCHGRRRLDRMILCPTCGNKRCPKASDHELACSGSNEAGQPGSVYVAAPTAERLSAQAGYLSPQMTGLGGQAHQVAPTAETPKTSAAQGSAAGTDSAASSEGIPDCPHGIGLCTSDCLRKIALEGSRKKPVAEATERVTHDKARDIIRIAWEGAFAGPRFETMLRYIDQQQADGNALKYWSTRARELEASTKARLEQSSREHQAERERLGALLQQCSDAALRNTAELSEERDELKAKLAEAGDVLGAVCVAGTLRHNESLITPVEHAALDAVHALLADRDKWHSFATDEETWRRDAEAKLAALDGVCNCAPGHMDDCPAFPKPPYFRPSTVGAEPAKPAQQEDHSPSGQKENNDEPGNDRGSVVQSPRKLDGEQASSRRDDAQAGERGGVDGAILGAERAGEGTGPRDGQDGAGSVRGAGVAEVAAKPAERFRVGQRVRVTEPMRMRHGTIGKVLGEPQLGEWPVRFNDGIGHYFAHELEPADPAQPQPSAPAEATPKPASASFPALPVDAGDEHVIDELMAKRAGAPRPGGEAVTRAELASLFRDDTDGMLQSCAHHYTRGELVTAFDRLLKWFELAAARLEREGGGKDG